MFTRGNRLIPGNKRKSAVLVDGDGADILRSDKLRAVAIRNMPAVVLAAAVMGDELLIDGIVAAAAGDDGALRTMVNRLPPRGRVPFHLMLSSAAETARRQTKGEEQAKRLAQFRLLNPVPLVGFEEGALEPGDPQRWRGIRWRSDAADTVVSIATRRCLVLGCQTLLSNHSRSYCHLHCSQHDRATSRDAAKRHDARRDAAVDLLEEVAHLLPRHSTTTV